MACGNNTLAIGRPSSQGMNSVMCSSSCGSSTGSCGKIGPRHKREKVREEIRDYILQFNKMIDAINNISGKGNPTAPKINKIIIYLILTK